MSVMKSASWLMFEDDFILRQCNGCGFTTRSLSTYKRHSRNCLQKQKSPPSHDVIADLPKHSESSLTPSCDADVNGTASADDKKSHSISCTPSENFSSLSCSHDLAFEMPVHSTELSEFADAAHVPHELPLCNDCLTVGNDTEPSNSFEPDANASTVVPSAFDTTDTLLTTAEIGPADESSIVLAESAAMAIADCSGLDELDLGGLLPVDRELEVGDSETSAGAQVAETGGMLLTCSSDELQNSSMQSVQEDSLNELPSGESYEDEVRADHSYAELNHTWISDSVSDAVARSESVPEVQQKLAFTNESCDGTVDTRDDGGAESSTPSKRLARKLAAVKVGPKVYVCRHCEFKSPEKSEHTAHVRREHAGEQTVHRCAECDYHTMQHKNLERHLLRHLLSGPFQCVHCSFSSTSQSAVQRHMAMSHSLMVSEESINGSQHDPETPETAVRQKKQKAAKAAKQSDVLPSTSTPRKSSVDTKPVKSKSDTSLPTASKGKISSVGVKPTVSKSDSSLLKNLKNKPELKVGKKRCRTPSPSKLRLLSTKLVSGKVLPKLTYRSRSLTPKSVASSSPRKSPQPTEAPIEQPAEIPELLVSTKPQEVVQLAQKKMKKMRKELTEEADGVEVQVKVEDVCCDDEPGKETLQWTCLACGAQYDLRAKVRRHVKTKHGVTFVNSMVLDLRTNAGTTLFSPSENLSDPPENSSVASTEEPQITNDDSSPVPEDILMTDEDQKVKCKIEFNKSEMVADVSTVVPPSSAAVGLGNTSPSTPKDVEENGSAGLEISNVSKLLCKSHKIIQNIVFKKAVTIKRKLSETPACSSGESSNSQDSSLRDTSSGMGPESADQQKKCPTFLKVIDKNSYENVSSLSGGEVSESLSQNEPVRKGTLFQMLAAKKHSKRSEMSPDGLKCAHCSYTSQRLSDIRRHLLTHTSDRTYTCSECPSSYKHESSLLIHQQRKHRKTLPSSPSKLADSRKSPAEPVPVPSASSVIKEAAKKQCNTNGNLGTVKKSKKKLDVDNSNGEVEEKKEPKIVKKKKKVLSHEPSSVTINPSDSKPSDERVGPFGSDNDNTELDNGKLSFSEIKNKNGKFICKKCNYVAKHAAQLERHTKIHTGQRDYWCNCGTCSYRTIWRCDMKRHLKKFHAEYVSSSGKSMPELIRLCYRPNGRASSASPKKSEKTSARVIQNSPSDRRVQKTIKGKYNQNSGIKSQAAQKTAGQKKESGAVKPAIENLPDAKDRDSAIGELNGSKLPGDRKSCSRDRERFRPFKCSECGRRSNWRWDLINHIKIAHPSARVIVLSLEVARATFGEVMRRFATTKGSPESASVWRWKQRPRNLTASAMKSDDTPSTSRDSSENAKEGRVITELEKALTEVELPHNSIGMVDMLRLKRFQCSGCPYRSNHRGDLGRHIRMRHGRGTCRINILSTDTAAATLHAYRMKWNRKKAWLGMSRSQAKAEHRKTDKIKQSDNHKRNHAMGTTGEKVHSNSEPTTSSNQTSDPVVSKHLERSVASNEPLGTADEVSKKRLKDLFGDEESRDFTKCCDICPFRSDRTGLLELHKLRHRAPSPKNNDATATFSCPHCPYFVRTSRQLERHMALHDDVTFHADLPVSEHAHTNHAHMKTKYICEKCPFVSTIRNVFWVHRNSHLRPSNEKALACDRCPFWVSDRRTMKEHAKLHRRGYYPQLTIPNTVSINHTVASNMNLPDEIKSKRGELSEAESRDMDELKACPRLEPVKPSDLVINDHDVAECCPLLEAECMQLDIMTEDADEQRTCPPILTVECERSDLFRVTEKEFPVERNSDDKYTVPMSALQRVQSAEATCTDVPVIADGCRTDSALGSVSAPDSTDLSSNAVTVESCHCELQCPYCFFAVASVRLLRQHMIFHVAVSDAISTPVFDTRLDNFEDGEINDRVCAGMLRRCNWCQRPTVSDADELSAVGALSEPDEQLLFFVGLSLQWSSSAGSQTQVVM